MKRKPLALLLLVGAALLALGGYFSIAIAFDVAARELGFSLAPFSVFVFTAASPFLAIQPLAQGVGAVATLILNARHTVMSPTLRDRIEGDRVAKTVLACGIALYAMFIALSVRGVIRFW